MTTSETRIKNAVHRTFTKQGVTSYLLTPFTVYRTALDVIEEIPGTGIIPMQRPCHHWLDHGSVIKTEKTFRSNVEQLLTLSSQRHEPLVLMTFACYVPEDYSLQRFEEKKLDYASHRLPVEIWGNPANVQNSVNAHNRVLLTMAGSRNVTFVDQASIIPHSADFFNDCCHLTSEGCELFVESIVDAIQRDSRLQLARDSKRSRK